MLDCEGFRHQKSTYSKRISYNHFRTKSPNSMLCAWMTPESNIEISLTRIERIDCRGQVVQRKEQVTLSEEELCTLRRFFSVIEVEFYSVIST